MNNEQLKILTNNINDIELIKLINEQDDYIIESILRIINRKDELKETYNISYKELSSLLNKVLKSDNNKAKKNVLIALNDENLLSNRKFDEINKLFDIIMNTYKDIDFEVRGQALTNKRILNNLNFEKQYKLLNETSSNIRNKMALIDIAVFNCSDFNSSKYKNELIELIISISDSECLNHLTSSFGYRFKYNTDNYYKKILHNINEYNNGEQIETLELKVEKTEIQKYQLEDIKKNIVKAFTNKKRIDVDEVKKVRNIISSVEDLDIMRDIYELLINEKFMSKVNNEQIIQTINLLSSCKIRSVEKRISEVFFNKYVLEYRDFNEMLSIINERMNNSLLKNNIIASNILLSEKLLEKRSNNEVLALFEELKNYDKDNNVILSNLISSREILENVSFDDQMMEIENFKKCSSFIKGDSVGHFYLNSNVIKSFTEEEKRKIAKKIVSAQSDVKASSLSELICHSSFYIKDNFDDRLLLIDRIESEYSDKVSFYIVELIKELSRYQGFKYSNIIEFIDGYTKTGIEYIDEIKEKLDVARLVSESKSIGDLKDRFTIK